MDRRAFLLTMSAAFGANLIAPLGRMVRAQANEIDPVGLSGGKAVFSDSERPVVMTLSEIIIPTTDTPGAIEAGVPGYIEFMLGEWYQEDERQNFLTGLNQLMALSSVEEGVTFQQLSNSNQTALVQRMHDGEISSMDEGGRTFFDHIKQLTLAGYYTSEIGMTVERVYLPVPGKFDGAYPYKEVSTLFTY